MFLPLSVSTTVWHRNCACLLHFVKQRSRSLFIVLDFEISEIINASKIFPHSKALHTRPRETRWDTSLQATGVFLLEDQEEEDG